MVTLTAQLDPSLYSGLSLTFRATAAGATTGVSASESPAGSGTYTAPFAAAAASLYAIALVDAGGACYWTGRLVTDAAGQDADLSTPARLGNIASGATVLKAQPSGPTGTVYPAYDVADLPAVSSEYVAPLTSDQTAAALLANPAQKLLTDAGGRVTLTPTQGDKLNNLDATVSSRYGGTPPTVAQLAAGILANPAYLIQTDIAGRVGVNNLPVELLTSAEQSQLTTAVNDLVALLGRTDTAPGVASIQTAVANLLTRLPQALLFDAAGSVKSTVVGSVTVGSIGGLDPAAFFAANTYTPAQIAPAVQTGLERAGGPLLLTQASAADAATKAGQARDNAAAAKTSADTASGNAAAAQTAAQAATTAAASADAHATTAATAAGNALTAAGSAAMSASAANSKLIVNPTSGLVSVDVGAVAGNPAGPLLQDTTAGGNGPDAVETEANVVTLR